MGSFISCIRLYQTRLCQIKSLKRPCGRCVALHISSSPRRLRSSPQWWNRFAQLTFQPSGGTVLSSSHTGAANQVKKVRSGSTKQHKRTLWPTLTSNTGYLPCRRAHKHGWIKDTSHHPSQLSLRTANIELLSCYYCPHRKIPHLQWRNTTRRDIPL